MCIIIERIYTHSFAFKLECVSAHVEQQSVLQIHEEEVQTIQEGNQVELNAQLFSDSCKHDANQNHGKEYHANDGKDVKVQAIFTADGTKDVIHGSHCTIYTLPRFYLCLSIMLNNDWV